MNLWLSIFGILPVFGIYCYYQYLLSEARVLSRGKLEPSAAGHPGALSPGSGVWLVAASPHGPSWWDPQILAK